MSASLFFRLVNSNSFSTLRSWRRRITGRKGSSKGSLTVISNFISYRLKYSPGKIFTPIHPSLNTIAPTPHTYYYFSYFTGYKQTLYALSAEMFRLTEEKSNYFFRFRKEILDQTQLCSVQFSVRKIARNLHIHKFLSIF